MGEPSTAAYAHITSTKQAIAFVGDAFATQVERAYDERTLPNAAVNGDSAARQAFLTLLDPVEQRALFLRAIRNRHFLPRIRTLVGSPPFSFLRPEDDTILRAAGITYGRAHMAHPELMTTNYSEFGKGHFEDGAGRLYRIIGRKQRTDTLPYDSLTSGETIVFDVRIPKRTTKSKVSIIQKRDNMAAMLSLTFPRPGETLQVQRVSLLRKPLSEGGIDPNEVSIRVEGGKQREQNSPIARCVGKVL